MEQLKPNSTRKHEGTPKKPRKKRVSDKGRIRRPTDGKQITGKASIIMVLDRYVGYTFGLNCVCQI